MVASRDKGCIDANARCEMMSRKEVDRVRLIIVNVMMLAFLEPLEDPLRRASSEGQGCRWLMRQ